MNPRTARIHDYILDHGEVTTAELCALFPDVSPMTIRRDLAGLEASRLIIRVHGGARAYHASSLEAYYAERENARAAQKAEIARRAACLLTGAHCVYLDAGTTVMALARRLPDNGLTVVTSAANVALELAARKAGLTVVMLGGTLNPKTLSCSGPMSAEQLAAFNIDVAFLGASGFTKTSGFTVGDWSECACKRAVVARAERVVMLMDSAKIGVSMPYTFARPREIYAAVSDGEMPSDIKKMFNENRVRVI